MCAVPPFEEGSARRRITGSSILYCCYLRRVAQRAEKVLWCSASVCLCVRAVTARRNTWLRLRGESNAMYPVLSSLSLAFSATALTLLNADIVEGVSRAFSGSNMYVRMSAL